MRALRRFTVRLALPQPLAPLGELVMNLRWSWHPQSLDLFRSVDPATWDAVGQDPVRLLGEVAPSGWPPSRRTPPSSAASRRRTPTCATT